MIKLESTRILKKLDGFSVLLALVLSSAFHNFFSVVFDFATRLTELAGGKNNDFISYGEGAWQDIYLTPVFSALIWVVAVEVFLQIAKIFKPKQKKK